MFASSPSPTLMHLGQPLEYVCVLAKLDMLASCVCAEYGECVQDRFRQFDAVLPAVRPRSVM